MTQKLFPESEVFTKERPKKLTDEQKKEFFLKQAEEIIENGWSKNDPETIAEDLAGLSMRDSGFEMAKDLDSTGMSSYDIDGDFVSWLDFLSSEYNSAIEENQKTWVKAHNIQPKFTTGTALKVNKYLSSELKIGETIYVTGIKNEVGKYLVWKDPQHQGGYVMDYERIEDACEPA